MADINSSNLGKEVSSIKESFGILEKRLAAVENALLQSKSTTNADHLTETKIGTQESYIIDKQIVGFDLNQALPAKENLEARIGQYWLNKIGVISLVIGVVFLILYSFQYFNATLKLLTGVSIATFLISIGDKISRDANRKWYGYSLMGGGWAIAYFVAYAMYFISDLKMTDSYPLEFVLLISVSSLALMQAVYRQAETIAILAIALAELSIGLSGPSLISNVPILVIALFGSIVALRKNWYSLLAWLISTAYISHVFASSEAYFYSVTTHIDTGWITGTYLLSFWLIFNSAIFFCKEETAWQRKISIVANCLNAIAFGMCAIVLAKYYFGQQESLFLGLAGVFYLGLAVVLDRRKLHQLKTTNLLIGLSFINAAIWMKFTGAPVVVFNLVEIGLLVILGLRSNIKAFVGLPYTCLSAFFHFGFQ